MEIYLVGFCTALLALYVFVARRRGLDFVLIAQKEHPEKLIGCKVQPFIPARRSQPGWIGPTGKVLRHEEGWYWVELSRPWTTEYGNLSTMCVRSAMHGNPVSRLAAPAASSVPIIVRLADGREVRWELGTGFETVEGS